MPGPLTPCRRINRRRSSDALTMYRNLDRKREALLGRTPWLNAYLKTCRLTASVGTEVTTGTLSSFAVHCPHAATESVIR
jgi:hypothetical protein